LKKIKNVTKENGGLRIKTKENEEKKQIVIKKKNGKVRVKRYSYRLEFNGDRKFFDRTFKFDEEITQKILASIRDCFNNREGNIIGLDRSEEHTSELQSSFDLVCRLLLDKK